MDKSTLISLDRSGLTELGDVVINPGCVRLWVNPDGDQLSLHYFSKPPDIYVDLKDIDALRAFYREGIITEGGALIEADLITIAKHDAIRTIFKHPQKPHGMIYFGSITLPFRDFSYVVKIQCNERGTYWHPNSFVLHEFLASGRVNIDREAGRLFGWFADPYDPNIVTGLMRNHSEDVSYDEKFPQHPLSRLRKLLQYH